MVKKRFPYLNLRLALKNNLSIGSFFRHKEWLEPLLFSGLIYECNCAFCNVCYFGSAARQYGCRISEYREVSVRTNVRSDKQPNSAIYDHSFETGHRILTSSFKILDKCREASQLRTLEALYICRKIPTLNSGLPVELSVARLGWRVSHPVAGFLVSCGCAENQFPVYWHILFYIFVHRF